MNMSVREFVYWASFMAGIIAAYVVLDSLGVSNMLIRIVGGIGAGICCGLAAETVYKNLKAGGKR